MADAPQPKYLVRIANTDLQGTDAVLYGIQHIKGVGATLANAVCKTAGVDTKKKAGFLTDKEVAAIEKVLKDPAGHELPTWLFNRRKNPETGENKHLITSDLNFQHDNDIKLLKKMKSYKGIRHILGQPVRGQRTRGNFRKNKGKVMGVKLSSGAKKSSGGKT